MPKKKSDEKKRKKISAERDYEGGIDTPSSAIDTPHQDLDISHRHPEAVRIRQDADAEHDRLESAFRTESDRLKKEAAIQVARLVDAARAQQVLAEGRASGYSTPREEEVEDRIVETLTRIRTALKFDEVSSMLPDVIEVKVAMSLERLVAEGRVGRAPMGAGAPMRYWA